MSETGDAKPGDEAAAGVPGPLSDAPSIPDADYSEGGVPSFDFVRDRIEQRAATADGSTELAGLGTGQDLAALDKQMADRDRAAQDKLAEIRRAMRDE